MKRNVGVWIAFSVAAAPLGALADGKAAPKSFVPIKPLAKAEEAKVVSAAQSAVKKAKTKGEAALEEAKKAETELAEIVKWGVGGEAIAKPEGGKPAPAKAGGAN